MVPSALSREFRSPPSNLEQRVQIVRVLFVGVVERHNRSVAVFLPGQYQFSGESPQFRCRLAPEPPVPAAAPSQYHVRYEVD